VRKVHEILRYVEKQIRL